MGNNRRSAQWRSQIQLLPTATTSIYWSDRLDRLDQLLRSAATFSCKTRRVAVYVETHYNIASKRAFLTGVLDRWHNCLLIYWRTSCIRRYLVSRVCDWVMRALSVVWLTFSFQFSLLFSALTQFCVILSTLQRVLIEAVDSTDRLIFSNQPIYSAVRLDELQCMCCKSETEVQIYLFLLSCELLKYVF